MSLINNMLKELEKRQINNKKVPYVALVNEVQKERFHIRYKTLLISGAIFLIGLFFLLLFPGIKNTLPIAPMLPNETILTPIDTKNLKNVAWINKTAITGVTLQIKDNVTEISFLLDHEAFYRLVSSNLENQFALIVDHAELQTELPMINYIETALQNMSVKQVGDNTKFIFTMSPGSQIKYVNLMTENKNPEIVVAIASPSLLEAVKNTNSSTVKTPVIQNLLVQQYQIALNLAQSGDYNNATLHLNQLLKIDPSFKDARATLAALWLSKGNRIAARQLLDEGLLNNPDYAPFIELKAHILMDESKVTQALALLLSASPRMDDNPDYYGLMAALYERTNNDALAVKVYRNLLANNNKQGSWWFGLGLSLDKLGNKKAAKDAYMNAMSAGNLAASSVAYLEKRLHALQEITDDKN